MKSKIDSLNQQMESRRSELRVELLSKAYDLDTEAYGDEIWAENYREQFLVSREFKRSAYRKKQESRMMIRDYGEVNDADFDRRYIYHCGDDGKMTQLKKELSRVEALLRKPLAQRVEEHYQLLLKENKPSLTEYGYKELAKKFREMEGYKNTTVLANFCDTKSNFLKARREEQEAIERERQRVSEENQRIAEVLRIKQQAKEKRKRKIISKTVIIPLSTIICVLAPLFILVAADGEITFLVLLLPCVLGAILGKMHEDTKRDPDLAVGVGCGCLSGCLFTVIAFFMLSLNGFGFVVLCLMYGVGGFYFGKTVGKKYEENIG